MMRSVIIAHPYEVHSNGNQPQIAPLAGAFTLPELKEVDVSALPQRPQYDPTLFLDRETEIKRFRDLLTQVKEGKAGLKRVLTFTGERGIGKSWLLQHLHHLARDGEASNTFSFLVRFDPHLEIQRPTVKPNSAPDERVIQCLFNFADITTGEPTENDIATIKGLLLWLADSLKSQQLIDTDLDAALPIAELSFLFAQALNRRLKEKQAVLVLFADAVYEADWRLIRPLEEYVLAPLVSLDRVAVVLAGRGQPFLWINSLLRIEPVQGALQRWEEPQYDKPLKRQRWDWLITLVRKQLPENHPFWRRQTDSAKDELTELQQNRLERIWEIARGHPLLTWRLADGSRETEATADDVILNAFIEDDLLGSIDKTLRSNLRQYLEALCVLDYFRDSEAERMVQARLDFAQGRIESENGGEPAQKDTPPQLRGREIIIELQRTYLVRWDRKTNQYFVDDTVRIAFSAWLQQARADLWQYLYEAAMRMYQDWAGSYLEHNKFYLERAEQLHLNVLKAQRDHAEIGGSQQRQIPTNSYMPVNA